MALAVKASIYISKVPFERRQATIKSLQSVSMKYNIPVLNEFNDIPMKFPCAQSEFTSEFWHQLEKMNDIPMVVYRLAKEDPILCIQVIKKPD